MAMTCGGYVGFKNGLGIRIFDRGLQNCWMKMDVPGEYFDPVMPDRQSFYGVRTRLFLTKMVDRLIQIRGYLGCQFSTSRLYFFKNWSIFGVGPETVF
jgi:hypothetical protein